MRASVLSLSCVLLLSPACAGSVCKPSCEKVYGDEEGQCSIQVPGHAGSEGQQELTEMCVEIPPRLKTTTPMKPCLRRFVTGDGGRWC